jgi:hypothetical protein
MMTIFSGIPAAGATPPTRFGAGVGFFVVTKSLRSRCSTRTQAEAGVVPRASHGVVDQEPLRERSSVMGTGRADREEFVAPARQHDSVVADVPGEHVSVREIGDRNSQRQVGTGWLRLLCAHRYLQRAEDVGRRRDGGAAT